MFVDRPPKNKRKRHLQPLSYKVWRIDAFLRAPIIRCFQNWVTSICTLCAFSFIIMDPVRHTKLAVGLCIWFGIATLDSVLQVHSRIDSTVTVTDIKLSSLFVRYPNGCFLRIPIDHFLCLLTTTTYFIGFYRVYYSFAEIKIYRNHGSL